MPVGGSSPRSLVATMMAKIEAKVAGPEDFADAAGPDDGAPPACASLVPITLLMRAWDELDGMRDARRCPGSQRSSLMASAPYLVSIGRGATMSRSKLPDTGS
jgi:hypothetical protein